MRNTIRTLLAEDMYNGLTFPRAKQYKIHEELTMKHSFPEQTLKKGYRNYMKYKEYILERKTYLVIEESFIEWKLLNENLLQNMVP